MLNSKKFILSFCTMLSLVFVLNIELYAASEGFIKGDNVRIRLKPSTSSSVVDLVSNQKVKILTTSQNWYKISFSNITGWVRNDFVTLSNDEKKSTTYKTEPQAQTVITKSAKVVGQNINVRSTPSKSAKIVKRISNKTVTLVAQSGDWYKISAQNLSGWVNKDFVSTNITNIEKSKPASEKVAAKKTSPSTTSTGFVAGSNVNIRSTPSKSGKIITKISNKNVKIIAHDDLWYKVSVGSKTGWIKKEFVALSNTNKKKNESSVSLAYNNLRDRIVLYSRNFLGVRYKWGGTTPKGFDCSGFTSYIYKKFGIKIERVSTAQATQGKFGPKNKLKPGDLVFFATSGGRRVTHAGVYIGDGKFIHASSSRAEHAVKISKLSDSFYARTYVTGRTFVK